MNLWCWFFDHKWEPMQIADSLAILLFHSPVEHCKRCGKMRERQ